MKNINISLNEKTSVQNTKKLKKINMSILYILIFSFLFIIDIINTELFVVGLPSLKELFGFLNSSTLMSQTFLTLTVTILTIFFAVYFIVIQLFRSRYPLDFIDKYVKNNLFDIALVYICNIIFGAMILIFNVDLILSKLFYFYHTIYCIVLFVKLYKNYKIFNPSEVINNYKKKIIDKINKVDLEWDEIDNCLEELGRYSEESFYKNELTVSQYILDVYEDLVNHFIENKDRLILNGEENCKKNIEEIEHYLFKAIIDQLVLCIQYNYTNYLENGISIIEDIMCNCISCDKVETFDNFYKIVDRFFRYSIGRENINACRNVIALNGYLAEHILKKELRPEWVKKIEDIFEKSSFTTYVHMNEKTLKSVVSEYFNFLEICIELNKFDTYYEIINNLNNLIYSSISKVSYDIFNYIKILYIRHTNNILNLKNDEFLKKYIGKLKDLGQFAFDNSNKDLCIHIANMYNYIIEKCKNIEILDLINDLKYHFSIRAVYIDDELLTIFMPDYTVIIKENNINVEKLDKIIDELENIISRTLLRKSKSAIFMLLEMLNQIILSFEKNKRSEQEKFFKLYSKLFFTCINNKSIDNFYIVLDNYTDLLKNLDKENNISEQLGERIIEIYNNLGVWCITIKQTEFCMSIIAEIADMPEELNFVMRKKELYSYLIDVLFQIGLDAVENNLDEIIRNVSNRLGWMAIYTIKNHRSEIFTEIINKATEMINVCIDFKINDKTIVFVGTLFIIIGAYTCSQNLNQYMNIVITNIKRVKQKDFLVKSKTIREYQSRVWNQYMGNNARMYIDKFYNNLKLA